ncbi:uncharacterized protein BDV17DRAFT_36470 [Aspergillus undulatus]|uniref:uncharacterized protein n=1 Tax=Aspergillus undulatus TaxID=1810928 RepID=UPI003CCDF387
MECVYAILWLGNTFSTISTGANVYDLPRDSVIENIIVNLSLVEPHTYSAYFNERCHGNKPRNEHIEGMIRAATETAKQTPSRKKIESSLPQAYIVRFLVYDRITGEKRILYEDEEWNWSDDRQSDDDWEISDQDLFDSDVGSEHELVDLNNEWPSFHFLAASNRVYSRIYLCLYLPLCCRTRLYFID